MKFYFTVKDPVIYFSLQSMYTFGVSENARARVLIIYYLPPNLFLFLSNMVTKLFTSVHFQWFSETEDEYTKIVFETRFKKDWSWK